MKITPKFKSTQVLAIVSNLLSQLFIRKMITRTSISILFLLSILIGGIREEAEFMIRHEFGDEVNFVFSRYIIPKDIKQEVENKAKQRFYSDFIYTWSVTRDNQIIGYTLLDNVKGKSMPITFIAMYNNHGEVVNAAVIKYREAIGGEVGRESWLKQFFGKNATSPYDDIDGISGATISVDSMTKGIQKLTLLLAVIRDDNPSNEKHETK